MISSSNLDLILMKKINFRSIDLKSVLMTKMIIKIIDIDLDLNLKTEIAIRVFDPDLILMIKK
jgi:hypothetical protein